MKDIQKMTSAEIEQEIRNASMAQIHPEPEEEDVFQRIDRERAEEQENYFQSLPPAQKSAVRQLLRQQ